jgi:hypothetical protein
LCGSSANRYPCFHSYEYADDHPDSHTHIHRDSDAHDNAELHSDIYANFDTYGYPDSNPNVNRDPCRH